MPLSIALPAALPSMASMPSEVKDALPALTVMVVNGAINFLIAVLILIAGWIIARWMGRWIHDVIGRSHYIDETLKPLISNFVRYAILAITVVAVLSQFGVQTTSLIALLGAAGLAIGLALQGTLSNVASGVMLLILRPFRVYEKIKVTDDGTFISIPNTSIFSATIVNVSREATRRTNFTVEVDRDENIDRVQKIILDGLAHETRVLKAPAPAVEVDALGPVSTTLWVRVWVRNNNFLATLSDIKKQVRRALQDAEIAAPIPVPPPSVQPWHPPAEQDSGEHADKPN